MIKLGFLIERIYECLNLYAKFGVPVHNFCKVPHVIIIKFHINKGN